MLKTQEPTPALPVIYGVDADLRRTVKYQGTTAEYYFYEGLDRVATLNGAGALREGYLFDGIDHPLRIKVPATSTVAYYELDLAGNVRRLRNSGGSDLGGYRYTAFGQTKEDTATLVQPLRWKARWHSTLNGAEVYDVRARQWAPELGAFLSIDEYEFHDEKGALWSWPNENPVRYRDPSGRAPDAKCRASIEKQCRDACSRKCAPLYAACVPTCIVVESALADALHLCDDTNKEQDCTQKAANAQALCLSQGKPAEICAEVFARVYARCMGVPIGPKTPGN